MFVSVCKCELLGCVFSPACWLLMFQVHRVNILLNPNCKHGTSAMAFLCLHYLFPFSRLFSIKALVNMFAPLYIYYLCSPNIRALWLLLNFYVHKMWGDVQQSSGTKELKNLLLNKKKKKHIYMLISLLLCFTTSCWRQKGDNGFALALSVC